VAEDAWVIANALFTPCYIGGWSAAEHWQLTEQVFSETAVLTTRRPQERLVGGAGARFRLKTIRPAAMFGFIEVWRGNVKVSVSTPEKTLVDMLDDPGLAGGARTLSDMLTVYVESSGFKEEALAEACVRFDSGAVFKRLGFMLERSGFSSAGLLELCREHLTQGTANLDSALECRRLVTRWKLWVPGNWLGAAPD
jgi:predicted transcriptional regulator of viral defense system